MLNWLKKISLFRKKSKLSDGEPTPAQMKPTVIQGHVVQKVDGLVNSEIGAVNKLNPAHLPSAAKTPPEPVIKTEEAKPLNLDSVPSSDKIDPKVNAIEDPEVKVIKPLSFETKLNPIADVTIPPPNKPKIVPLRIGQLKSTPISPVVQEKKIAPPPIELTPNAEVETNTKTKPKLKPKGKVKRDNAFLNWLKLYVDRLKKATSPIGVFIGDNYVSIVQIKRDGSAITLLKQGYKEYTEGGRRQAIVAAMELAKIESGQIVHVSISAQDSFLRYFEMDHVPAGERRAAAEYTARKYSPFSMAELYFDTWIDLKAKEKNTRVVLAGVKKDVFKTIRTDVTAAGLELGNSHPVFLSIAKCYSLFQKKDQLGTQLIVDLDDQGTIDTIIICDGLPMLARHSHILTDLNKAISPAVYIPEIRLSIDYFAKSFKGKILDEVVILADESKDALAKLITSELNMPAKRYDIATKIKGKVKPQLGIAKAMGIALASSYRFKSQNINLSPNIKKRISFSEIKITNEQAFLTKWAIREGIALMIILALTLVSIKLNTGSTKEALAKIKSEYTMQYEDMAKLGKETLEMQNMENLKKVRVVRDMHDNRSLWSLKMARLAQLLPEKAWLQSAVYTAEPHPSITINGTILAGDPAEAVTKVNQWVGDLMADEVLMQGMQDVQLVQINNRNVDGLLTSTFTIRCFYSGEKK